MTRARLRHLLGLLTLGTILGACGGDKGDPAASPRVPVEIGIVKRDSMVVVVEADGRLIPRPDGAATLSAPADAVVRAVAVSLGARVGRGAALIELDAPEVMAQAAALKAQAAAAATNLDRQRQLLAEGIAARRDVEDQGAAAEALAAQARAAAAIEGRLHVRAPLGGVVSNLVVHQGERVTAGQALVEVVDPARVHAAATVPSAQLVDLRPGQSATLLVEGATTEWPAIVEGVGGTVDSLSNTTQVLVRPRTIGPAMRPGAGVTIRIRAAVHRNVLVIPAAALVFVGNQATVFVVGADSIARAHPVTVVTRSPSAIEVAGALQAGDRVVTTGAYGLPDSARVIVRAPGSP